MIFNLININTKSYEVREKKHYKKNCKGLIITKLENENDEYTMVKEIIEYNLETKSARVITIKTILEYHFEIVDKTIEGEQFEYLLNKMNEYKIQNGNAKLTIENRIDQDGYEVQRVQILEFNLETRQAEMTTNILRFGNSREEWFEYDSWSYNKAEKYLREIDSK